MDVGAEMHGWIRDLTGQGLPETRSGLDHALVAEAAARLSAHGLLGEGSGECA